jgi:serine protease Do
MLSSGPLFADSANINTSSSVAGTLPDLTKMIKNNRSAVVSINAKFDAPKITQEKQNNYKQFKGLPKELEQMFKNLPQQPHGYDFSGRQKQAHGSGFIISKDGYVVTNAHVIDDSSNVTVELEDGHEFKAKVVGVDKLSDIALLKIEANDLPAVALGDSDKLDVGQWVVAIGTPFGLDYTATQGTVSALSRSLPTDTYVPFIQTDAAVNPGNSGGPLFDLDGQVVGVNSQIYSRSGGYMGVSFAIPINIVKNVTDQLKNNGQVSRGWLGVGIQGIDESLAESLGINSSKGSLVTSVIPDSPADKAGLQAGDVITQFDNKAVNTVNELPLLVGNTEIGKKVPVSIVRAGKNKVIDVTIDKLKGKDDKPVLASLEKGSLGVAVSSLSDEDKANLKNKNQGVKVEKVLPGSAAANAGLKSGDIILTVGGKSIESPSKLKTAIKEANGDKPLAILLKRGDQALFVAVHLNS